MGMKIKNKEWIDFKAKFLDMLEVLGEETEKFDIPEEMDNFKFMLMNVKFTLFFCARMNF